MPAISNLTREAIRRSRPTAAPMRPSRLVVPILLVLGGFAGSAAQAETLRDAMTAALRHYPAMLAEHARKSAAHAGIAVARSGYYPRLTASGDVGAAGGYRGLSAGSGASYLGDPGTPFASDMSARWGYSLMAEQPLFDGFKTQSAVSEAQAGAEAAAAQARVVEQLVLLEAATAYADLLRDSEVEALLARNVAALKHQVGSTQERARRGDATVTEIAQVRARHAQAIADLINARAGTQARAAEYVRVIGRPAGKLARPPLPERALPRSLHEALIESSATHPIASAAASRATASRHAVDRHQADGLPQVKLRGGLEGERGVSANAHGRDSASVSVRVVVPLLDGGETAARAQQALYINQSLVEEARGARERLHSGAVAAWTGLAAARERLAMEREGLSESRRALEGIQQEVAMGQRSVLEGLDAQRDAVAAEVRVETSERDLVVASYALLSAVGRLTRATIEAELSGNAVGKSQAWHAQVHRVGNIDSGKSRKGSSDDYKSGVQLK